MSVHFRNKTKITVNYNEILWLGKEFGELNCVFGNFFSHRGGVPRAKNNPLNLSSSAGSTYFARKSII